MSSTRKHGAAGVDRDRKLLWSAKKRQSTFSTYIAGVFTPGWIPCRCGLSGRMWQ